MKRRLSFIAAAISLPFSVSAINQPNALFDAFEKRGEAAVQHVQVPALAAAGMTASLERPTAFTNATTEQGIMLPLSSVPGTGPSSRYTSLLFGDKEDAKAYWRPPIDWTPPDSASGRFAKHGISPIKTIMNVVYLTSVNIGGQDFKLVLDTGSSDTWVASDPFVCRDPKKNLVSPESCRLNKHYHKTSTFRPWHRELRTAYADGETLNGEMGREVVTIGGVAANVTIGLVHDAHWNGDEVSSGLLGMAFPSLTRSWEGGVLKRYEPIFFDMFKQGVVKPVFSVALNRYNEPSGALALGGLPDKSVIDHTDEWAVAPMERLSMKGMTGSSIPELAMYIVQADFFTIGNRVIAGAMRFVVDTGTTMTFIPKQLMDIIAASWDPPLDPAHAKGGVYRTPCDSKPPKIALTIGGKELVIDAQDLFVNQGPLGTVPEKGKMCGVGVAQGRGYVGPELNMMGGTFLKSLVVAFDVGAAEMRFAKRVRKERKPVAWSA